MKVCVSCQRRLGHGDLLERESRNMQVARASANLEGVCFQYYTCPRCGHDHVFLEVIPLPGESAQDLQHRKESLALAVRELPAVRTTVLVVEQGSQRAS